ncbi:MAG: DUF4922 domain-containing protein [Prevotella sp.]|nr:DUF4922 domain-containing protein [Prevotella sp.]
MEIKEFFNGQLAQWPEARQRYDDLAKVQTRDLQSGETTLRVQWNPARMVSTGAKIDVKSLEKRPCFLCSANRPQVQFSEPLEDATNGDRYELLVNPFPILPMHFTVPLNGHEPQRIDGHYTMIHQLTAKFPDLTVFYNGPRCGASAPDHLHLQAGTGDLLPLRQHWSSLQNQLKTVFALNDDDSVALLHDFVVPAFVIRSKNAENDRRLFEKLYHQLSIINCQLSILSDEPMMNIVAWREADTMVSVIFPRRKHRPDCYFAEGDDQMLVSPGALDVAGLIITPRQHDFERITAEKAEKILQECAIDEVLAQQIAEKIVLDNVSAEKRDGKAQKSAPTVTVGIVSAREIHFSLNEPYSVDGIEFKGAQTATFENGAIVWNKKRYNQLIFKPLSNEASFTIEDVTIGVDFHWNRKENQSFRGMLRLSIDDDKILVINELSVEQYLESVISSEMSATSSLELLKAHAVISRSWLLAQIEGKKRNSEVENSEKSIQHSTFNIQHSTLIRWYDREDHALFDVCADDHCQRYQGITRITNPLVAEAVRATRGQVLTFSTPNTQHPTPTICDTRFSKCCGGRTEEFQYCWEDVVKPYLTSVECPYCHTQDAALIRQVLNDYDQETPDFYEWKEVISSQQIAEWLRTKHHIDLGNITDLIPLERGKSGRIWKLEIVGTKGSFTIGKELEIRRTLSDTHLKSSWFEVEKIENHHPSPNTHHPTPTTHHPSPTTQFILNGRGWGHGVGLCQIGAAVMGENGKKYDEILKYYYIYAKLTTIY